MLGTAVLMAEEFGVKGGAPLLSLNRCRFSQTVGHQTYIHAAVLGAARGARVLSNRVVLAESDQEDTERRNVVLLRQVPDHGIGPALAELIIVLGGTG